MRQEVRLFSSRGHDVLLEYDTTDDMTEVNRLIDQLEQQYSGKAFSMSTAEQIDTVTPETRDIVIVRPIAGG